MMNGTTLEAFGTQMPTSDGNMKGVFQYLYQGYKGTISALPQSDWALFDCTCPQDRAHYFQGTGEWS